MSKIKLTGSNSGYVEISSAADAGNLTLQLPTAGTALLSNAGNVFSGITTTGQLDINGSIDVSSTSVFNDDLTLTGASYNVVWDKSDNQLEFGDNAKLSFGGEADLQLYHDGTRSHILNNTDELRIRGNDVRLMNAAGNEHYFVGFANSYSAMYYDNSQRIKTESSGVTVTGTVAATSFSGSGANLTGLVTPLSFRNLIINGDHRISQRGTAAVTVTTSAQYRCVDRFKSDIDGSGGGDFSHAQSTDVPAGQGFTHSSKITTVTQASQPSGTSNRHQLYTMLEKQDVAHLEWGTSAAKTCTLSFWVKSSVAGIYPLWFQHYSSGGTKYYFTNYTINATNTWEKKSITLTGSTSGGNVSGTNAIGFRIEWNLGTSSGNETGTLNEWTTSGTIRAASGSVYLPENAGATWYLTGCQFEVGSVMTPFEHRSFAEELVRCQRYCYRLGGLSKQYQAVGTGFIGHNGSTDTGKVVVHLPTTMRTNPSVSVIGNTQGFWVHTGGAETGTTDMSAELTGPWDSASSGNQVWLDFGRTGGGSPNRGVACVVYSQSNNAAEILFQAEL